MKKFLVVLMVLVVCTIMGSWAFMGSSDSPKEAATIAYIANGSEKMFNLDIDDFKRECAIEELNRWIEANGWQDFTQARDRIALKYGLPIH